jgi:hypothetical protein
MAIFYPVSEIVPLPNWVVYITIGLCANSTRIDITGPVLFDLSKN